VFWRERDIERKRARSGGAYGTCVATKDVGEEGGAERGLESKAWSGRAWLALWTI
jgi:hypothetical protein